MDYEKIEKEFYIYVASCREKIEKMVFTNEDRKDIINIRRAGLKKGLIDDNATENEVLIAHRNDMINIKIDHTMRVVSDIILTAQRLGLNIEFDNILKVAALLHDIGRFDQATWSNNYTDSISYQNRGIRGINNHAIAGYHHLFVCGQIKNYSIDRKFYPIISQVTMHHGDSTLPDELNIKFDQQFIQQNINEILNKTSFLNKNEKLLVAVVVQLVRDVDMIDIFYQYLTGEIPVVSDDCNYCINGQTLEQLANKFNITEQEILDYNGLKSSNISSLLKIRIPLKNADLRPLEVPQDIKDSLYNKKPLNLQQLMKRSDWTYINGIWWRLSQFLLNINFISTLERIKDSELLDKIYEKYPERFRFLVKDAFAFAKEELIQKTIYENKDNIYIMRNKKN